MNGLCLFFTIVSSGSFVLTAADRIRLSDSKDASVDFLFSIILAAIAALAY